MVFAWVFAPRGRTIRSPCLLLILPQQSGGHHPKVPATIWWVVVLTTAVGGCGDVHFMPAPFTPQNVELVYSEQEHLTIVRWRVEAAAPSGEVAVRDARPDGYQPIDFSRSVFAGGVAPCGDDKGSCAQYVVRGHYPQQQPGQPVSSDPGRSRVLRRAPGRDRQVQDHRRRTFSMKSFFNFKNDPVFVNPDGHRRQRRAYKFPRPFERAMWPTAGLCLAETLPNGVVFRAAGSRRPGFRPRSR